MIFGLTRGSVDLHCALEQRNTVCSYIYSPLDVNKELLLILTKHSNSYNK